MSDMNEQESYVFKKNDIVWYGPKDEGRPVLAGRVAARAYCVRVAKGKYTYIHEDRCFATRDEAIAHKRNYKFKKPSLFARIGGWFKKLTRKSR